MAMFRHTVKKRARILTKAEFRHALKVAGITREPARNQLLLCLSHALGLRVTELARVTIDDVMTPSGRLRSELACRAALKSWAAMDMPGSRVTQENFVPALVR